MSQKTNPLSLRLQKGGNHHFSSPWFTDAFFSDTFQYESSIRKYIDRLLKETQYSKAFFSTKSFYRKFNILFSIQDTRAQKKEKQLLFNLKSNLSSNKKQSFASKFTNNFVLDSLHSRLTQQSVEVNRSSVVNDSILFSSRKANSNHKSVSENQYFSNFLRNKVRDNFLKFKQNYNLRNFVKLPAHKNQINFDQSTNFLASNMHHLETIIDYSYGMMLAVPSGKFSFIEVLSRPFAQAQQKHFQKIIKNRNCFTYCEKIVSEYFATENIKQKENLDLSLTFLGDTLFEEAQIFDESHTHTLAVNLSHNLKLQSTHTIGVSNLSALPSAQKLKKPITHFEPIRFVNATQSVVALLDQIVVLLEKRVSFREIKSKLFKNVERNCLIKGVRFSCSGRLGGRSKKAQKAKTQSYQWGETSLNAFSSKIVFANKSAITPYGKVGVKIWLSFRNDTRFLP